MSKKFLGGGGAYPQTPLKFISGGKFAALLSCWCVVCNTQRVEPHHKGGSKRFGLGELHSGRSRNQKILTKI